MHGIDEQNAPPISGTALVRAPDLHQPTPRPRPRAAAEARIPTETLVRYAVSEEHDGQHKTRVGASALAITASGRR